MPSFPNPVFPDRDAANWANSAQAPSTAPASMVPAPMSLMGSPALFPALKRKNQTNQISPEPLQSKGFAHAAPPHRDPIPPPGRPSG